MKNAIPMHLESYTLRIDVLDHGEHRSLRGIIEHPSCEVPIAFNGLFELWHAIHHFAKATDPDIKTGLG